MEKRELGGLLISFIGLVLIFIFGFKSGGIFFGIIVLVVGLVILFNKNEDKIEEIKGLKGGKLK